LGQAPPIALLGICQRSEKAIDSGTGLQTWNALGIRNTLASFIFPLPLNGFSFLFALYAPALGKGFEIVIRDEALNEIASSKIATSIVSRDDLQTNSQIERHTLLAPISAVWVCDFPPCECLWPMVLVPGLYTFYLREGADETAVGSLHFVEQAAPPLTPDRIAALRSDPAAAKQIGFSMSCGACKEGIRAYAGLERSAEAEAQGEIWHANLPDSFKCTCGKFITDLRTVRSNLPGLLVYARRGGKISTVPLYERMGIEAVRSRLLNVLANAVREEAIQVFFAENTLTLHLCCPCATRIIPKAPVLTRHFTDFVILGSNHELVLVELEKASTRLLTKRGGIAAPLQHAFDQANEWLQLADDQRSAFLDALGIEPKSVAKLRGIVIAGRDGPYDARHLRALKGRDFGRVAFLSYDDVAASLQELADKIGRL
jgi:hypothetical protein